MADDGPIDRRLKVWRRERADARLFRALGAAHGLSRRDLRLLLEIAERAQFVRRSEVFVHPTALALHADPARHAPSDVERVRARLAGAQPPHAG